MLPEQIRAKSLIFKRLTLQSDQMTQYVDVETERMINEALEFAEDIKISIANNADLINLDWIVKDTTNFIDKFQTIVDALLGHLPGEIIPVDDKIVQRFTRAGPRGRGREWETLGVHPLSWLLSNNRLEEVCSTLTKCTFSSRLLLSNQVKGCSPSVAHSLPLPLGPALLNLSNMFSSVQYLRNYERELVYTRTFVNKL